MALPLSLSRIFSRHLRCNSLAADFRRSDGAFACVRIIVAAVAFSVGGFALACDLFGLVVVDGGDSENDEDEEEEDDDDEDDDVDDADDENVDDLFMLRTHDDSSCLYRYDFSANDLPQRAQVCGFVFECVWTCARRFDLSANDLAQTEHSNGFSPGMGRRALLA